MKNILIGKIEVPLVDYAVGASAILGIRDSGKTVTAKGIAEQLIDNGVQVIVFDAVGKWRWMKKAGPQSGGRPYKVVVAGGNDPDLPLTPHSVVEIVRAALKERIPLIIDLFSKTMSKSDWRQIVQKAIRTIHYENEGGATHIFLEEAAEFCPQKIYDGETYAEIEKLVRMGGNASVGITLINQRSQEINKAVLDNCSTALVLGCQVGKNAIEAVSKWIERLDSTTAKEVTESLPRLKSGEAWVWTRKSLEQPTKEKMPMCRSLHPDRRTPDTVLKSAKTTDTADFVARMATSIPKVIEEAKNSDPLELRRKVADLERQLASKKVETKIETKHALEDKERKKVSELILTYELNNVALGQIENSLQTIRARLDEMGMHLKEAAPDVNRLRSILDGKLAPAMAHRPLPTVISRPQQRWNSNPIQADGLDTFGLPKGGMEVLTAIAQKGEQGATDAQIAVLTGYKKTSRVTYRQKLAAVGFIQNGGRGYVATEKGISALGKSFAPLPTGQALQEHCRSRLSEGERKLFEIYVANYPNEVSIEQIMELTGYKKTSVVTYRQKLAARDLIEGKKASNNLFD